MSTYPVVRHSDAPAYLIEAFNHQCRRIISAPRTKALDYAISYARAGLGLRTPEGIKAQANYILVNITHWKAPPTSTEVRAALKSIVKELDHA